MKNAHVHACCCEGKKNLRHFFTHVGRVFLSFSSLPPLTVVSKAVVATAPVSKKVALSAAVTTLATKALPALAVVS